MIFQIGRKDIYFLLFSKMSREAIYLFLSLLAFNLTRNNTIIRENVFFKVIDVF